MLPFSSQDPRPYAPWKVIASTALAALVWLVLAWRLAGGLLDPPRLLGIQVAGLGLLALTLRALLGDRPGMNGGSSEGAEEHFNDFFGRLPVGVLLFDGEGRILRCNPRAAEMLHRSEAEILAMDWLDPTSPFIKADGNPWEPADLPLPRILAGGVRIDGDVLGLELPDGSDWLWVSVKGEPLLSRKGALQEVLLVLEDATSRTKAEAELTLQTFQDRLTSLPNRTLFMERLQQSLLRMERKKNYAALLYIDLDRFKLVNDSLGHSVGDRLLVQVASRLRSCLRPDDTVARLGGDDFAVLFEDLPDLSGAINVAERIHAAIAEPFQVGDEEVYTGCSMGLALTNKGLHSPGDLVRDAELAMYRAKAKNDGAVEIFDPSMNQKAKDRFRLEAELRHAIERSEFLLNYQPLISFRTGRIEGWEALIRWKHPERGMVSPLDFIPLAEETGLIVPIGQWVLEEACRQASEWQQRFHSNPPRMINVNLSMRQFQQKDLVEMVTKVLTDQRLRPRHLKLEITESVMMKDPEASIEAMQQFKSMSVNLVIDDFGTGYSSLSYLKRFPVDALKVDKSFVDRLGQDSEDTAIVEAIISLSKALGLRVTAEGIETKEQFERLKAMGCDQGQGYYFSRPLMPEAMEELLGKDPSW
jgi:diguanylate cyclase (GGDEF)-like protein/PAS domain S-box-containing protein